ncbi:Copia protein, partial [Mucuna pruriens]
MNCRRVNNPNPFGCECFILDTKENLRMFNPKLDKGIFLGYSKVSKAYRVYNLTTLTIKESIHVKNYHPKQQILGDFQGKVKTRLTFKDQAQDSLLSKLEPKNLVSLPEDKSIICTKWVFKNKLDENGKVIINKAILVAQDYFQQEGIDFTKTFTLVARLEVIYILLFFATYNHVVSLPEDKSIICSKWVFRNKLDENGKVIINKARLVAQDYFQQEGIDFTKTYTLVARLEVIYILLFFATYNHIDRGHLVSLPEDKSIICTKWVFRNKLDENGKVIINKARLVAQGYFQQEGIDFTKTFTLVARLEVICILLFFATYNHVRPYQMDIKCAFLNGIINEEVYVKQSLGFESDENGFSRGKVDTALFHKNYDSDFIIMQIYVDDMIFCAIDNSLYDEFSKMIQKEFEISMIEELKFFMELQISQTDDGIYIQQSMPRVTLEVQAR